MNAYKKRIEDICPELNIRNFVKHDQGQNNDVYIVNESLIFRFPKYESGIRRLKEETEILAAVKNHISLPIPEPIYQSFDEPVPGKVFTGYPMIPGKPFGKKIFNTIKNPERKEAAAGQLTDFLGTLHSIPKEALPLLPYTSPRDEMINLYHRIQGSLFTYIRPDAQKEIVSTFESAFNGGILSDLEPVLIHGDFGASNILWDEQEGRVSGIIDFGGSGLGDPAYDFAGLLSSYGEDFFAQCLAIYPGGRKIAERVKFYRSTFALLEALHGVENDDPEAFENGIREYR